MQSQCTIVNTSVWILLRMRNVSYNICREKVVFNNVFQKLCVLWDNWENTVERGRAQVAMWPIRVVWWITKNTNPHWIYVILFASSLLQLLRECASILHYKYLMFVCALITLCHQDDPRIVWVATGYLEQQIFGTVLLQSHYLCLDYPSERPGVH